MAVEGIEFGVEVDSAYSNVAASWFGFTEVSNDCTKPEENEKNDGIPKKKKKRESGEVQHEVHVLVKEPKKHKRNLSSFIDEKLTKKLKKSKRKAEEKEDDEKSNTNIKTQTKGNTEEDSKTAVIKKKYKPSHDAVPSHSIESLTKRLASGSLSQSTRKRLKKKLNKLIKESGSGNDTKTKSETSAEMPAKHENSSLSSSSPTSENKVRESSPLKRKLEGDASEKEEESHPTKKKKKKKRSKQKNIKKDNRPDHLKPPHLRNSEMAPLSPTASVNTVIVKEKIQIESGESKVKNTKQKNRSAGSIPRKCIEDKDISESRPKKAKAKG